MQNRAKGEGRRCDRNKVGEQQAREENMEKCEGLVLKHESRRWWGWQESVSDGRGREKDEKIERRLKETSRDQEDKEGEGRTGEKEREVLLKVKSKWR